jgi:hypothetical protein
MIEKFCDVCGEWVFAHSLKVDKSNGVHLCKKCFQGSRLKKSEVSPLVKSRFVWINVYSITREFGGHEEGGWYYNFYDCIFSKKVHITKIDKSLNQIGERFKGREHGNIYSVLGGEKIGVFPEIKKGESQTKTIPHYE